MKNTNSDNGNHPHPFYGIEIGSIIKGNTGLFQASVIPREQDDEEGITRMIPDKYVYKNMTGVSSYIYNDKLNQGFAGVSGSYGLSGVARINSGLSVHMGNSVAELTKKVTVNYNVQMISGVEYINFNNLTVEDLINSLDGSPRQMALIALENYNKLMAKIGTADLITILKDAASGSEIITLVEEWVSSVQAFFREHGDGIVTGVVWGGIGTVSLTMNNESTANSWKYGSKGNFTYAGLGKAITVEAAYDGSNSNRESKVGVESKSWFIGDCVAAQVAEWSKAVEGKAFSEISGIDLLAKAPQLDDIKPPPTVPAFNTPAKNPGVADKIKEIKDLKSLEAFAKAAAYDKAKETEPELTLEEFLARSRKEADSENVEKLQEGITMNNLDVLAVDAQVNMSFKKTQQLEASIAEKSITAKKDNNFTALGVWIANWSNLFPWMATGYLNQIDDISSTREIIKKQCMIQDFLTLSKIYFMLQATGISSKNFQMDNFDQIANSFSNQAGEIRDNFDKHDIIQTAYEGLGTGTDTQKIYKIWNDIKFLRSAELGLGVLHKGKSIKDNINKTDNVAGFTRVWYDTDRCSFSSKNYSVFSSFLKVVPFITPEGDIYAFGPSQMILNQINDKTAIFSRNPLTALKLEVDTVKRILKSGDTEFHPIPFEAAKNMRNSSWKGQSISTNVASIKSIDDHIKNAIQAMEDLNVYSFSSSNWNPNWKPEHFYSISSIKLQYLGLVDEIPNILPK